MKLIASITSPYVRKVRVVMAEKKLDYQIELENVWAPDSKIQSFNPLGKVPCLIMEDNSSLFDSAVIVEYLDTLSPVSRLIPQGGRDRAAVKCWEALADGAMDACVIIIKELQRPAKQQSAEWIERQYGKIKATIEHMEKGLGDDPFCMGINFTLADIAVGCLLGLLDFRFAHLEWRNEHPNLDRLYQKLAARQSFLDTVPVAA
ncbi:glutathione S-transferase [Jezberella montanilacus]|jgi:glutathione S-transferase|uniref:Glutathione S-transferase n=1 Tax=Jezberella montanilacus TaxID=323426 RepID=A0A2T0XNF2_9BURK|nr:glutathione S-transferase C-terminal domain-containing protein [Jezberella montanilacus]PRZ00461.1 glutathione S-transferase [Jezberella montanilacus]|eukprot:gene15334-15480_t